MSAVHALPRARSRSTLTTAAPVAVPVALGALSLVVLRSTQVTSSGPYGLIQELPPLIWPVWLALIGWFVVLLRQPRLSTAGLGVSLLVWVGSLHGAPALLEPETRFGVSWRIAGFVDYLARTGHTLPRLDARMSWPGVLATLAGYTQATGLDPITVARWWPLAVELVLLLLAAGVFRACLPAARQRWLALWILVPVNWVGQDYYAPQSVSLLLYVGALVVLLTWFGARTRMAGPLGGADGWALRQLGRLGPAASAEPSSALQRVGLGALLVAVAVALACGHQLTPAMLVAGAGALFLVGRSGLASYAVLAVLVTAAYVSYFAVPFWSGHLSAIFGGLGKVGGTVSAGVGQRAVGAWSHRAVVAERMGFSVAVGGLALAGALRWARLRRLDVALPALVAAPVAAVALQSYGGEVILRVFVFAAVPLAACIALLLSPRDDRGALSTRAVAGITVFSLLALPAFLVARYGNESYEMALPGEVAVTEHLYSVACPGATLALYGGAVAFRQRDVEAYRYADVRRLVDAGDFAGLADGMLRNPAGAWLLLTSSQETYGTAVGILHPGWRSATTRALLASGRFRIDLSNAEATLLVPIGGSR